VQSFHAKVADQPGADVESGQQVRLSLSVSLFLVVLLLFDSIQCDSFTARRESQAGCQVQQDPHAHDSREAHARKV
jgi:hypothetical protein